MFPPRFIFILFVLIIFILVLIFLLLVVFIISVFLVICSVLIFFLAVVLLAKLMDASSSIKTQLVDLVFFLTVETLVFFFLRNIRKSLLVVFICMLLMI